MKISEVYLAECTSTNDILKDESNFENPIALYTFNQTKGRGQQDKTWTSEANKNIAISFGFEQSTFPFSIALVSMWTANVMRAFLANYFNEKVFIKWPNDIIVNTKKTSGILIENAHNQWIIGIGINVNQIDFENLPRATSIKSETAKEYDLQELTNQLIRFMELQFPLGNPDEILPLYNHYLYQKNKNITFQKEGKDFKAKVIGVNENGQLRLQTKDPQEESLWNHGQLNWTL